MTADPTRLPYKSNIDDGVDAKLRLLTFAHPQLAQSCVDTKTLREKCPLDNKSTSDAVVQSAKSTVASSLGLLDALPTELSQQVLYALDLQSLTDFRQVNKRARFLVDCLRKYNTIVRHVPTPCASCSALLQHPSSQLPNCFMHCRLRNA